MNAHQDNYKKHSNFPLEAQLNYHYDDLAKAREVNGIMDGVEEHQKLPLESVCVSIRKTDKQQTTQKGYASPLGKKMQESSTLQKRS